MMKSNKLNKNQKQELKRVAQYLVSGGAFFWSGYFTFFAIDKGLGLHLWWATSLSYIVGWTINFLLQRYWVFDNPELAKHQTAVTGRYMAISLVNLAINYGIIWMLKNVGITPYIGQFVSAGFFTIWNYFWYKHWVFPEKFSSLKKK